MRSIIIIFCVCLILFSCTDNTADKNTEVLNDTSFSRNSLEKKYLDEGKWRLYCYYLDDTLQFWNNSLSNQPVTLGQLELKFEHLVRQSDTLLFYFSFYLNDSIRCNKNIARIDPVTGVAFKENDSVPFAFIASNGVDYLWNGDPQSRFVEPLQPEVIKYIRLNGKKLNAWFYKEALMRGIVDSIQ